MKHLTDEQLLDEINECAEIFIRSSDDNKEIYEFHFEELKAFLVCFGGGLVKQLNEHNEALKWSADWLMNHAKSSGNPEIIKFASKVAMTLKSQIRS